ncbi:MAG TPA: LysM peptidoglycan-binding domain-containing M23 family metallopeptidase [Myxococcota bacterium]|nr:LysM peptidoglycan-binding domain-containing M23 family metallopeptidase [Myxococcota bacterium]
MHDKTTFIFAIALLASACGGLAPRGMLTPVPDAEAVGVFHVVGPGENLISICRDYGSNPQEVAELNGIEDPGLIRPGQKIFIPDVKGPLGKNNDRRVTSAAVSVKKYPGQFIWPVDGMLTSKFGIRHGRRHDGIDIGAAEGAPVHAAAAGKVLYSGDQQRGYGNLIIIRHAGGMITVYAHNKVILIKEGEKVEQGQVISRVGHTGRANGPHLHFEIRKRTKPRNPLFFLPRKP